jgi:hypothetical protein
MLGCLHLDPFRFASPKGNSRVADHHDERPMVAILNDGDLLADGETERRHTTHKSPAPSQLVHKPSVSFIDLAKSDGQSAILPLAEQESSVCNGCDGTWNLLDIRTAQLAAPLQLDNVLYICIYFCI